MTAAIPTLQKAGLFDIFPPEEWARGTSEGRRFVGMKAMQMLHPSP